jgi:hypothetical protein
MIRFYVAPFFALCYVAVARNLGIAALVGALPLLAVCFAVFDVAFGTTPAVATGEACGQRAHVLPWLYIPLQIAVTLFGAIGTVAGIFGMLAAHEMIPGTPRNALPIGH